MFCKNCGRQIDPNAAVCVGCGVKKGDGLNFCQNCGASIAANAVVCTNCGSAINNIAPGTQRKSKMCAGLLGVFLGGWGVHNFYLGFTTKAIIQIVVTCVTCGLGGLWGFIEGIMILCGSMNADANGNPLE